MQSWRTLEFPSDAPDSRLTITLSAVPEGTRIEIQHDNIPAGQGPRYYAGWLSATSPHGPLLQPQRRLTAAAARRSIAPPPSTSSGVRPPSV